ncbi:hypothetical protein JXO59_14180 [candidate division KSB1 bacterium]|nr:hypothetical protein [candidate division KSB1 bacterium]
MLSWPGKQPSLTPDRIGCVVKPAVRAGLRTFLSAGRDGAHPAREYIIIKPF